MSRATDLTRAGVTCDPAAPGRCALCGDEALPARVVAVDAAEGTARVVLLAGDGAAAGERIVALDLVDGAAAGDVVLVHQGFAIARMEGW